MIVSDVICEYPSGGLMLKQRFSSPGRLTLMTEAGLTSSSNARSAL